MLIDILPKYNLSPHSMQPNKRKYYGKEASQCENSLFKQSGSNSSIQEDRTEVFSFTATLYNTGGIQVEYT